MSEICLELQERCVSTGFAPRLAISLKERRAILFSAKSYAHRPQGEGVANAISLATAAEGEPPGHHQSPSLAEIVGPWVCISSASIQGVRTLCAFTAL